MNPEISLTGIGTDGAVIGATDDGFSIRIETAVDNDGLRMVTVTAPGFSMVEKVHTPNIGLAKARDIITARRRRAVTPASAPSSPPA